MSELIKIEKEELELYSKSEDEKKIMEIEKKIEEEKQEVIFLKKEIQRKVKDAAIEAFVDRLNYAEDEARLVVQAITRNEIPNIFIKY